MREEEEAFRIESDAQTISSHRVLTDSQGTRLVNVSAFASVSCHPSRIPSAIKDEIC